MSFCSSFRVRASSQLLSSRPSSRSAFSDTSHLPGPRHYTGRVPEYGTPAGSAVCDASTIHRRVGRRGPAPLRSHARRARWRADWLGGRPGVDEILIGKGEQPVYLLPRYGNRHGLVAGATGTGKTVSLLVMAEGFSRLGDLLWGTRRRQGMVEALAKQAARTVGSEIGRQILRGVLGSILGGTRRR